MLPKGQIAQRCAGRLIRRYVWEVRGSTHASNIFYFSSNFLAGSIHLTFWGSSSSGSVSSQIQHTSPSEDRHPLDPSPARSSTAYADPPWAPRRWSHGIRRQTLGHPSGVQKFNMHPQSTSSLQAHSFSLLYLLLFLIIFVYLFFTKKLIFF